MLYADRSDAGRKLADALEALGQGGDAVVLALPRGGVPVAFEVASRLRAPLDIYMVRKLGVPGQPELAMGAVASDASYVVDRSLMEQAGVTPSQFRDVMTRELAELRRREEAYRDGYRIDYAGKTIVLVDDGLATGATMYAAVEALRTRKPAKIVVAVPVASRSACRLLETVADAVVCPWQPKPFHAVGFYYQDFSQVEDETVRTLLRQAEKEHRQWKVA
jgi:predicted phosphoribosyltransferase